MKPRILHELRNGPGTCTEITARLRSHGHSATELEVHRALRALVESGEVMSWSAIARKHMRRDRAEEGSTVHYELAAEVREVG